MFCIMGDGEQQEGSIWEAVMEGSHYKLDNLVGIIDRNRLQIDGWVKDVMNVEPLDGEVSRVWVGGHRGSMATTCGKSSTRCSKREGYPAAASRRDSSRTR